jgi:hypothetical protein
VVQAAHVPRIGADYRAVVNPIQGQNPWLALPSATQPTAPATPFDPAQLLDPAQTAAGDAPASLFAQDSGATADLFGSDMAAADPSVAAAMVTLQGLTGPQQLPAVGADVLSSYLASAGTDAESSSDSDPASGTDFYV